MKNKIIKNFKIPAEIEKYQKDTGGKSKQPRGNRVVNAFIKGKDEADKLYKNVNGHTETEQWLDNYYIFISLLLEKFELHKGDVFLDASHLKNGTLEPNNISRKRAYESGRVVISSFIGEKSEMLKSFSNKSSDPNVSYPGAKDGASGTRKPFMANFYWIIQLLNEKGVEIHVNLENKEVLEISDDEFPSCDELIMLAEELKKKRGKEPTPDEIFDLWQALNENKQLNDNVREKLCNECFTELT
ncbi:hypothetical protein [sulfur-oxidizing endosymbiont of Gigantopelta aegis]|uniref:hypothetical protein n=1 Tax=sulfur-oxidizing endosymbiont of Gigantopelta aegis TaxID=2794934 RepID=UPI0018DE1C57|nr:hypothetical protein [sulfur-oxidizing endosymbiont of Gigantopelta aegis]